MKKRCISAMLTIAMIVFMTIPAFAGSWKQEGSTWKYYDQHGSMMTGWVKDKGVWYYMNEDGTMATGWIQEDEYKYYLQESGAMTVDWKKIGGNWYFFYSDGVMAHSTWIDNYYVNADGQWVKTR